MLSLADVKYNLSDIAMNSSLLIKRTTFCDNYSQRKSSKSMIKEESWHRDYLRRKLKHLLQKNRKDAEDMTNGLYQKNIETERCSFWDLIWKYGA